jgi:hypothetical protein
VCYRVLAFHPGRIHGHVFKVRVEIGEAIEMPNSLRRLHLLRPSPRVMFICKIVLISEWVLVTTPNTILAAVSGATDKYNIPYAYSITQRIEPAVYAAVCFMLSGLYMYYAFVMFRRYRDQRIRNFLLRLLFANILLMGLDLGNIIIEYVGGGVLESCYLAFFYSFVCGHGQP